MASVSAGYRHVRKLLVPGPPLTVPGARLKWYDLHREEHPIPAGEVRAAREFVGAQAAGLGFEDELGFVILHRVGDAYLLLVSTWRGDNECWKTVYFKDSGRYAPLPHGEPHIATFCVWELGAVRHEQEAWIRFLESARTEADALAYLADLPPSARLI
ncbi:hypothetical protein [Streptomyces sp. NPDC089919]|uniref:hypothetical protein n=1 Tax=Streptomyces sp. NPDC089919 TaxID=3155188 RepID=UPI00344293DD